MMLLLFFSTLILCRINGLYYVEFNRYDNDFINYNVSRITPEHCRWLMDNCGISDVFPKKQGCATDAEETSIRGGQSVKNPWLTIGGVATSVCQPKDFILPNAAIPGDVLVLTKPLRTQKMHKILECLENVIHMKHDEMKISLTFKHSEVEYEAKLVIAHNLLESFDVPHTQQDNGNEWEFIRGKVWINVKIEKIEDQSLICHLTPP